MHLYALCANFSNYLVDILVIVSVLGFGLVCLRKGFISCFLGFVSTFAAFFIALFCTGMFVSATNGLFGLSDVLGNAFEGAFLKIEGFSLDVSVSGLTEALTAKKIPKFLVNEIVEKFGDSTIPAGTTLAMLVGDALAGVAISVIGFLVLFCLLRLVLFLLRATLNALVKRITLLEQANRLLGFAVGVLECLLLVSAVLGVLAIIPSESITAYLSESLFVGALYNHNPITVMLGWFL